MTPEMNSRLIETTTITAITPIAIRAVFDWCHGFEVWSSYWRTLRSCSLRALCDLLLSVWCLLLKSLGLRSVAWMRRAWPVTADGSQAMVGHRAAPTCTAGAGTVARTGRNPTAPIVFCRQNAMNRYRQLLRRRDFALLWGGATVSALGDGMSFVALVWLLLERGGSSADVGWLAAVYTAPVVVGGLVAGVVLDRFDRRRVLAADNLVRGVAIATVPLAAAAGALTTAHLFVVAAIYGLLYMTSVAGIPSLIPGLVDEDDLTTANAMESISYGIAGLAGPALAGLVIVAIGAPAVLAVDAVSYAIFVACLLAMRPGTRAAPASPARPASPGWRRHPAGRALRPRRSGDRGDDADVHVPEPQRRHRARRHPALRARRPRWGCDDLRPAAERADRRRARRAPRVGAIDWRWPLGRSISAAALVSGLILSLLLLRPGFGAMVVILAASGLAESSLTPWAQTIRMRLIPPELRGRVFALLRTLMQATRPIGALFAGLLLVGTDLTPALAATALLVGVPGLVGLFVPALAPAATGDARPGTPERPAAGVGPTTLTTQRDRRPAD